MVMVVVMMIVMMKICIRNNKRHGFVTFIKFMRDDVDNDENDHVYKIISVMDS